MHKLKRGQVTLFVVIGIIVIILVGALLFTKNNPFSPPQPAQISSEVQEVKNIIQSCLDQSLFNAIAITAAHGGYYKAPIENSENSQEQSFIPYYYDQGEVIIPELSTLTEQLSEAVGEELGACITFPSNSYSTTSSFEQMQIDTIIKQTTVQSTVHLPTIIRFPSGEEAKLEVFSSNTKTTYWSFAQLAKILTVEQSKHPETICISCVATTSEKYNLTTRTEEIIENNDYLHFYYVTSNDPIDPVDFFAFAHRLSLPEEAS